MADGTGFPPGVAEKIKAIGAKFDKEILAADARALRAAGAGAIGARASRSRPTSPMAPIRARSSISTGPEGRRLPVLVYIPGGGYVGGDKNADGVFYGNLGIYFARHGYLTVVANYRLAPAHPWPAGAQDVAGAIAWAQARRPRPMAAMPDGSSCSANRRAPRMPRAICSIRNSMPASGAGVTAAC